MTHHLHFVREVPPDIKQEYKVHPVYCPECKETIYVIHVNLPPEVPKLRKNVSFRGR